jgi:hypothetical protein
MKKSLIITLALVFVLGIAGTAFAAANPFVDVPAKHWSYEAVSKLVKAGIVDGYGDGTFRGDRTMTRYEMAVIVAKAMANEEKADADQKASIEKLQAEFSDELDKLGVRVTKLEKKVGNIKLTGDARLRYDAQDKGPSNPTFKNRFRLGITGDVNDNTSFFARLFVMKDENFGENSGSGTGGGKDNYVGEANLTTRGILPNTDVTLGRYSLNLGQTTYLAGSNGGIDGINVNVTNGKTKLTLGYADMAVIVNKIQSASNLSTMRDVTNFYYAELNYKFNDKFKADINYLKNQDNGNSPANDLLNIFGGGLTWNLDKNFALIGDYWKNSGDTAKAANNGSTPAGYVAKLAYKGAKASNPGSFGLAFEYQKMEPGVADNNLTGSSIKIENVKSTDFLVNYTLAKNILFEGFYQFNMEKADTGADYFPNHGDNYTRLQINYLF